MKWKLKENKQKISQDKLEETLNELSGLEKRAEYASRQVTQQLICHYLKKFIGDEFSSMIVGITEFGLFCEIEKHFISGLLHVSDLSHGRVKKPSDLVNIGQKLKVKITKIDEKTNRVSASVKALTEDPYANIEKKYKVGEIHEGTVTKIMDYGCFVKIEDGIEGLIHNSELDWANRNIKPSKVLAVSQKIKFKIVNILLKKSNFNDNIVSIILNHYWQILDGKRKVT